MSTTSEPNPPAMLEYAPRTRRAIDIFESDERLLISGATRGSRWWAIVYMPLGLMFIFFAIWAGIDLLKTVRLVLPNGNGWEFIWSPLGFVIAWLSAAAACALKGRRQWMAGGMRQCIECREGTIRVTMPFNWPLMREYAMNDVVWVQAIRIIDLGRDTGLGELRMETTDAIYQLFFGLPIGEIKEAATLLRSRLHSLSESRASDMVDDL